MRTNKWKRITAVLTAAVLLLAGCGNPSADETDGSRPSDADKPQAMGRYVESSVDLPDGTGRYTAPVRMADGSLCILDYNNGLYRSTDEGVTWKTEETPWFQQISSNYLRHGCIAEDGSIFLVLSGDGLGKATEGDVHTTEQVTIEKDSTEEETEDDPFDLEMHYLYINSAKEVRELNLKPVGGELGFLFNVWFSPEGRLFAADYDGLYEIDPVTGGMTKAFETERYVEAACFSENLMVTFTKTRAYLYDLGKNELLEKDTVLDSFVNNIAGEKGILFTTGNSYSLTAALDEDNVLYLACGDGIYRHVIQGSTMEQLVTGSMCSLGDPSAGMYGMLLKGDVIQILFGKYLSSFQYDAGMPSVPDKELKVYSLERNTTLRKAVSDFQKKHQDVYVNYEIGMNGSDSQTKEDALKVLNTRILAGEGPDVIMLDGLPVDSYIEKGMLTDLTGVIEDMGKQENLFDNIARLFQTGDKIPAVPLRFTLPMIAGSPDAVRSVTDLTSLASYLEELRADHPQGTLLQSVEEEPTLRLLASVCAPSWSHADGSLNEERVKEFLTLSQRIYAAESSGITQAERGIP